jgi:hypothetical protein
MSRSIDLYSYDYEKLVNRILEVCDTDNRALIEKVLDACGNKISDRYVILNQEFWEDYSCYYNVAKALEKIFKVDDVFGKVFCTFDDNETDRKELTSAMDICEIFDEMGIEMPVEEDYCE